MSLLFINHIDFSLFLWYNSIINKNEKNGRNKNGKSCRFGKIRIFKKG